MVEHEDELFDENDYLIAPNGVKRARTLGPFTGGENHVLGGKCPTGDYFGEIMSIQNGSYNSSFWEEIQEWYEENGFDTYLRTSDGKTRTRSGTTHSASTSLYFW